MRLLFLLLLAPVCCLSAEVPVSPDHAAQMARGLALFDGEVRRLLADHCVKCHGGEKGVKGDLDLATRELLLKGGEHGAAVVPGKSAASLLLKSIRHEDPDLKMPQKADKLPDAAIAKIAEWIDLGAPYGKPLIEGKVVRDRSKVTEDDRKWWSFQPLAKPQPPAAKNDAWCRTPIDRFVLAKLEAKGLAPNPPVEKRTLIRRAYFDLIGLPPTPEQIDRFLADASPGAYEKVIDELLASPHYGERWGRHWLDLARYAESHGYEQDYDRPNAWHYRDYVIRALNADQPFDEFVRWQIAGDELAPDNAEAWKATGFLAAGTHATQITANQAEKERYDELDDMAATIGTSMLGLTVGCARCHDHKFDPIPIRDYYRLISTFTKTVRSDHELILNADKFEPAKAEWDAKRAELTAARDRFEKEQLPARLAGWEAGGETGAKFPADAQAALAVPAAQRTDAQRAALLKWFRGQDAEWKKLEAAVTTHAATEPKPEKVKALISSEGVKAVRNHTQGPDFYEQTFFLSRGDLNKKEGEAKPGFLQILARAPEDRWITLPPGGARTPWNRASLAKWLTDSEAGAGQLVARVIVNRLWQHHFGRGIVATPSDFGAQGEKPTHPELLDWLAGELIRGGWKLKPLHKLMMTSAAYMQGAEIGAGRSEIAKARAADPDNTLVWRHPRKRLEGEVIRDSILAVTGTLDPKQFGPGTLDGAMKRRSVYFQIKRSQLPPMMVTFDAPDTLGSLGLRSSTTVAPQALLLMNNAQVRDSARAWATALAAQPAADAVKRAYLTALGRPAMDDEVALAAEFLRTQTESYKTAGKGDAAELALTDFCHSLVSLNEFVYVE
jgi:cytochrome c553